MIRIANIMNSKKSWKSEFNRVYDYFKQNIGEEGCFEKKVKLELEDGAQIRMSINAYLSNLALWRPAIRYKIPITLDMVLDTSNLTGDQIKDYLDNNYIRPLRLRYDLRKLNIECATVIEKCKKITEDFGLILGITYNIFTMNELRRDPEVRDLMNTSIPEGLQPNEIEDYASSRSKRLMEIMGKSNTGFAPMINSRVGFKAGQFQEFFVVVGNKPDLDGNTLPVPINTNIMVKGLDTPAHYTIDAKGGRKALIFNKKFTGSAGYLARKMILLTMNINVSKTLQDCGTKQFVKVYVEDKDVLARLEGKYYQSVLSKKYYRAVKANDYFLIGQTIYMRSVTKCKGDHKGHICRTCYGELSKIIEDVNAGIIASSTISSRFTQLL